MLLQVLRERIHHTSVHITYIEPIHGSNLYHTKQVQVLANNTTVEPPLSRHLINQTFDYPHLKMMI